MAFPASYSYTVVNIDGSTMTSSPTIIYDTVTISNAATEATIVSIPITITETASVTFVSTDTSVTTDTVTIARSTVVVPVYPMPTPTTPSSFKTHILPTGYSSMRCANSTSSPISASSVVSAIYGYSPPWPKWNSTLSYNTGYSTGTAATYTGAGASVSH